MTTHSLNLGSAVFEFHHKSARQGTPRKDPVVLLHPFVGCWQFWRRTLDALPDFECYAPDLYSLGSDGANTFASPQGIAQATITLMDARRIDRFTLIGNSVGGIAAQLIAIELGNRVGKLVLIGTGASNARGAADIVDWLASPPDRLTTKGVILNLLSREPAASEMDQYVDALMAARKDYIAAVAAKAVELDLRPRLHAITAPTLIVRGEFDRGRTREHVRDLMTGIRNSEAIEMSGAGHSPQVDSAPDFLRILRDFLERGHGEDRARTVGGRR